MSSGLVLKAGLSTPVQRMSKRGMFNEDQSQKRAVQSLSWESYVRDELSVIDEDPQLLPKRPQLHSISLHDLRASDADADRDFHDEHDDDGDEDADEIGGELLLPAVERRPSAKTHMAAFVQRYRARLPRGIAKREMAKELMRRRFSQLPPEPLPILRSQSTYRTRSISEGRLNVPFDPDSISMQNKATSSNRSNAIKSSRDGNDSERAPNCDRRSDREIDSEPDSSVSRNRSATNNYLEEVSDNLQRVMDAFERRSRERAALLAKSLGQKSPSRANPSINRAGPIPIAATKSNAPSTSTNGPSHAATRALGSTDAALSTSSTSNSVNATNSTTPSNEQRTRKQGTALAPDPGSFRLNLVSDAPDAAEGTGGGTTRRMSERASWQVDSSRSPYAFAERSSNRWRHSIASDLSQQTQGVGENLAIGGQKQQCDYEARLVAGLQVQYVRPLLHKTPRASVGSTSEGARVRVCSRLADLINGRPNPGVGGGRGPSGPLMAPIEPPLVTGRAIGSARAAGVGGPGGSEKRGRSPSLPPAAAASSRADAGATDGVDANLRQRDYELLRWLVKDQNTPVAQRH